MKEQFKKAFRDAHDRHGLVTKMVVAVKLPTGATELIINTEMLGPKMDYYLNAYDDEMKLKTNPEVQVVGWLFA